MSTENDLANTVMELREENEALKSFKEDLSGLVASLVIQIAIQQEIEKENERYKRSMLYKIWSFFYN